MNKPLTFKRFSILFPIATEIIIGLLLHFDGTLTPWGIAIVMSFWLLLSYIFCEFIIFIKEFKEFKELKSFTESILNEFAESNLLVKTMSDTIKEDLEFDKVMKNNKDHLDLHIYILKLKLHEFFASHFIYSSEKKSVLQIPTYYFQNRIWETFVSRSYCYYSLQLLDDKQSKIYLDNKRRLLSELNILENQLSGKNKTVLKKLFVLESKAFNELGQIVDGQMREYLQEWLKKFNDKFRQFPIKVINKDDAEGALGKGSDLNDIGIFGDTFGIQSLNSSDGKFYTDALKIDFYFDKAKTNEQKEKFCKLFDKARPLCEVLKPILTVIK